MSRVPPSKYRWRLLDANIPWQRQQPGMELPRARRAKDRVVFLRASANPKKKSSHIRDLQARYLLQDVAQSNLTADKQGLQGEVRAPAQRNRRRRKFVHMHSNRRRPRSGGLP